ncbi:MAG TPA: carboxypeptidase-like regulatory domain-containing protein, partial [Verrucomicrobiae bacterium]
PIRERFQDFIARIRNKTLVVEPDPIVLKKGGILKISVRETQNGSREWPLFGQVSGNSDSTSNFWVRPEPGVIATRRLAEGTQVVSVVQFDRAGAAWFSEAHQVVSKPGVAVELEVDLQRGVALRGAIDRTVPRPIKNGRVIVQITPSGHLRQESPPGWHSWAKVNEDGRFEIPSLPPGDLEVVALCQGFISTNGPGKTHMRYPQKHVLGTNDLEIEIGMEPTTRLEVTVLDDKGQPLPDALVMTAPNVRYGEWAATIFASDLYKTEDLLRGVGPTPSMADWMIQDFSGKSDKTGVAVLPNLPPEIRRFYVHHDMFGLPVVDQGRKEREAPVTLRVGVTNYVTVKLERLDQKPIAHR